MNILNNLNLPNEHWAELLRVLVYAILGALATPAVQANVSILSGIPLPILTAVIAAAIGYLHKVVTVPSTPPAPPAT